MRVRIGGMVGGVAVLLMALAGTAYAQEGDPERGGRLFVENCAVCHGVDGRGRIGASLANFPGIDPGPAMQDTIARGVPGSRMPAWGQEFGGPLSDQDIADLAAYILATFEGTQPITPLPEYSPPPIEPLPDIEGDPSLGAVVFRLNCAMCHGDRGQGRFGLPLAKAWSGNAPEVYIHQVVSEGIQGTTMPAWADDRGGPLTDTDIDNVAAFVLTLEPVPAPTEALPAEGPLSGPVSWALLIVLVLVVAVILIGYYRRA